MIKLKNKFLYKFLEILSNKMLYLTNMFFAVFIPVLIGSAVLNPYLMTNKFTIRPSLDSLTVMFLIGLFFSLTSLASLYFINRVYFKINVSKKTRNIIDMILFEGVLFSIGFFLIFCYFQKNKIFPSISYSLLMPVFLISLFFLLTSYIILRLLKFFVKNTPPKTIIIINALLLVGSIASNGLTSPQSIVKFLGLGNYHATLVLTEEGCQSLSNIPGLKVSPQRTLDNILVFWGLGERWFIEVKDGDNQVMIITLQNDFISQVISNK